MMSVLLWLKSRAYLVGALLTAVLAVIARVMFLKTARDKARDESERLRAQAHANRIKSKIVKEEKKKLSLKESNIIKQVKKEGEEFEGLDNLTDSNDWD